MALCIAILVFVLHGSDAAVTTPPGYTVAANTDCGGGICASIVGENVTVPPKWGHLPPNRPTCGLYGTTPCNVSAIAAACDATPGCEGFNTNGWLKACLPPRCPAAAGGVLPLLGCSLYTKRAPPRPSPPTPPPPPPAPVPARPDQHYPIEEGPIMAALVVPTVTGINLAAATVDLKLGGVTGNRGWARWCRLRG